MSFPNDFYGKAFAYLRQNNGSYDLFVAIPTGVGKRAVHTETSVDGHRVSYIFEEVASLGTPEQVEAFAFYNIQMPPQVGQQLPCVSINRMVIDFEDADINQDAFGNVAENCPYLLFRMRNAYSSAIPRVIVPLRNHIFDPASKFVPQGSPDTKSLIKLSSSALLQEWAHAAGITDYATKREDTFEVEVMGLAGGPGRRTKAKNRNQATNTIIGGQLFRHFLDIVNSLVKKLFGIK